MAYTQAQIHSSAIVYFVLVGTKIFSPRLLTPRLWSHACICLSASIQTRMESFELTDPWGQLVSVEGEGEERIPICGDKFTVGRANGEFPLWMGVVTHGL